MQVPQLAPATLAKLRDIVPSFGSLLNPIDVTAAIFNDLSLINRTLQAILDDPNVDCIAMINASLQGELAQSIAAEIVAVAREDRQADFHRVERARCGRPRGLRAARRRAHSALQVAGALRARAVRRCRGMRKRCAATRRSAETGRGD